MPSTPKVNVAKATRNRPPISKSNGRRRALLVGINDYPGNQHDLPSCVDDARAMGAFLFDEYGFECTIIVDDEATQDRLRAALSELVDDARPDDRLVFFYSGHGTTITRGGATEECLYLADGSAMVDDDFVSSFARAPVGTSLVILDSCFSGGMNKLGGPDAPAIKRVSIQTDEGGPTAKGLAIRRFGGRPRPISSLSRVQGKAVIGADDEAADNVLNALLMSACLEGETAAASTDDTDGMSAFTYALLRTARERADIGAISDLMAETTQTLRSIGIPQTPQVKEPPVPALLANSSFPLLGPASASKAVPAVAGAARPTFSPELTSTHPKASLTKGEDIMVNGQGNIMRNGVKGNGLSDQPESVQKLMASQLPSDISKAGPAGVNPAGGMIEKFLDPFVIQILGTVLQQVVNAVGASKAAPAPLSKGDFKTEYRLAPGHFETFPTWSFWGETHYSLLNTGTVPTVAMANDRRYHLNPGESTEDSGKFAAFPLRITNTIESPGSELAVTVW